jgi:hypothetical protein
MMTRTSSSPLLCYTDTKTRKEKAKRRRGQVVVMQKRVKKNIKRSLQLVRYPSLTLPHTMLNRLSPTNSLVSQPLGPAPLDTPQSSQYMSVQALRAGLNVISGTLDGTMSSNVLPQLCYLKDGLRIWHAHMTFPLGLRRNLLNA